MVFVSHHQLCEEAIAQHDLEKPFSPENGTPLKYAIGDTVIFTNDYGCEFTRRVTGYYKPSTTTSLYAVGYRYLLDTSSPWMPVKEADLRTA